MKSSLALTTMAVLLLLSTLGTARADAGSVQSLFRRLAGDAAGGSSSKNCTLRDGPWM